MWYFFLYVTVFVRTIEVMTFRLCGWCMLGFCCRHSPVQDMNVRIFWVRAMGCMCAQTRPRFILSSELWAGGMESEPMLTPKEKNIPSAWGSEENGTHDATRPTKWWFVWIISVSVGASRRVKAENMSTVITLQPMMEKEMAGRWFRFQLRLNQKVR